MSRPAQESTTPQRPAPPPAAPRARRPRQAKVVELRRPGGAYGSKDVAVPWLRLSGRWLAEAGFAVGQRFEIGVEQGRLRLEAVAE